MINSAIPISCSSEGDGVREALNPSYAFGADGHVKSNIFTRVDRRNGADQVSDEDLLGFFVAAALSANVLRHLLHVPREEIRNAVLRTAAIAMFLAVVFVRWKRRP